MGEEENHGKGVMVDDRGFEGGRCLGGRRAEVERSNFDDDLDESREFGKEVSGDCEVEFCQGWRRRRG